MWFGLPVDMRTAVSLTILLLVTSLSTFANVHAEVPTDGSTVRISADETWNGTNAMNGNVIVENGSTLTIEGEILVATNYSMTIEEGATLILTGSLLGDDLDSELNVLNNTQLNLNFGDLADSGQLRINFAQTIPESAMFNMTIGEETVDAAGQNHIFIDVSLNGTDLVADFDIFYAFGIQIVSIQALHSGSGDLPILLANEINQTNGSLNWKSASFLLDVHGTMLFDGATLFGADVICSGVCDIQSSSLVGSAPIHVNDGSSIVVNSSSILGSRTDEDIVVHDLAQITYTDNQGTGGFTDGWIRLLSQRQIQTNAPNITVNHPGIGYANTALNNYTDSNGLIDIGGSEWKRIVEWVDGNGIYHSEEGELTLTLSSPGWGDFSTTVPAPHTPTATINVPLPYIEVVSIDAEDTTAEVNKKIGAMVSVRNTGDATATVNIWCYVDDIEADTTTLTTTLAPGEEKDLPISWWANTDGPQILNCRVLVPTILQPVAVDVTNLEGGYSQEVGWYIGEETEDQPLIVYGILVVVILIGTSLIARKAGENLSSKEVKEYIEDEEIDDND